MVVLSIAIGTKLGKLLLCRDFSEISRTLVEDCMNSLPQLIKENQEHTFVEHNNLRLNYLPLGSLYLLSINDRGSNILEDIEVLRSVQSAMHWILNDGISEDNVCLKAIDIILTLDDLISLGHRNISSESMLNNALEMDSANERLMIIQKDQQEKEAKKKADEWNRDQRKKEKFGGKGLEDSSLTNQNSLLKNSEGDIFSKSTDFKMNEEKEYNKTSNTDGKKTLKLGTQKKKDKIKESNAESGVEVKSSATNKNNQDTSEEIAYNPLEAAVKFSIIEKLECELDREGHLLKFAIKGDIQFNIQNTQISRIAVLVESKNRSQYNPKVPPSFNKKMWTEDSVLMPRDDKSNFQSRMTIPAIKYSFEKEKGNFFPIQFSIWLSERNLTVECEFNGEQKWVKYLSNIKIKIPNCPGNPQVQDKTNSDYIFNKSENYIEWTIQKLSSSKSDASINIDFSSDLGEDSLFPWNIDFVAPEPFGDFEIKMVKNLDNDEDVKFETSYELKLQSVVN